MIALKKEVLNFKIKFNIVKRPIYNQKDSQNYKSLNRGSL